MDKKGNIIDANPAACTLVKYNQYDLIDKNFSEIIIQDEEKWQNQLEKIRQDLESEFELTFQTPVNTIQAKIHAFLGEPARNPIISLICKQITN